MSTFSTQIQILLVNDARSGTKNGRDWKMQDAECILLDEAANPVSVGVLMIPKELMGKITPGVYTASFTLRPDLQTRKINAAITSLVPVPSPIKAK